MWIAHTSSPWRDLPEFFGKWNTVFKRYRDWVKAEACVIMDVEATIAICQAEAGAANTMLDRTAEQLDLAPSRLIAMRVTARPRWSGGWWSSVELSRT